AELGVYANLRPSVADGVELLIVRELVGGLYYGARGVRDDGTVYDTCEYHPSQIERLVRRGFEYARGRRRRLASVDKANVRPTSRAAGSRTRRECCARRRSSSRTASASRTAPARSTRRSASRSASRRPRISAAARRRASSATASWRLSGDRRSVERRPVGRLEGGDLVRVGA